MTSLESSFSKQDSLGFVNKNTYYLIWHFLLKCLVNLRTPYSIFVCQCFTVSQVTQGTWKSAGLRLLQGLGIKILPLPYSQFINKSIGILFLPITKGEIMKVIIKNYFELDKQKEAFHDVILAYHWSNKMYIGLSLDIQSVYWSIIGHLYCMTKFFYRHD